MRIGTVLMSATLAAAASSIPDGTYATTDGTYAPSAPAADSTVAPAADGQAGADGQSGMPGTGGMPGSDGQAGMVGANGSPGMNGAPGSDGQAGMPGAEGQSSGPSQAPQAPSCADQCLQTISSTCKSDPEECVCSDGGKNLAGCLGQNCQIPSEVVGQMLQALCGGVNDESFSSNAAQQGFSKDDVTKPAGSEGTYQSSEEMYASGPDSNGTFYSSATTYSMGATATGGALPAAATSIYPMEPMSSPAANNGTMPSPVPEPSPKSEPSPPSPESEPSPESDAPPSSESEVPSPESDVPPASKGNADPSEPSAGAGGETSDVPPQDDGKGTDSDRQDMRNDVLPQTSTAPGSTSVALLTMVMAIAGVIAAW